MTGSSAALVSFEESSALLHELAGVEVSAKQVERAAEALGVEIADDERSCVEQMGEVAPTMYLGMDGTGVPMRAAEVAARTGKQPDGSAKTREATRAIPASRAPSQAGLRTAATNGGIQLHITGGASEHEAEVKRPYQP
jgi:hypothetical protein